MKTYIALLCFGIAIANAQNICLKNARLAANSLCQAGGSICRDLCDGIEIYGQANCSAAAHCCFLNNVCILKTGFDSAESINFQAVFNDFAEDLNGTVSNDTVTERLFQIGGPQLPPGFPYPNPPTGGQLPPGFPYPSPPTGGQLPPGFPYPNPPTGGQVPQFPGYCPPKFPQTCQIQHGFQADFSSPVNIPYCQRIACSPSNPTLESNIRQCLLQPGCSFDYELFQYRSVLGQAVLPGVPICHLAVRNRAFQTRVAEYAQEHGAWNPLLTDCLIDEYRSEIFEGSTGCAMIDVLQHFGYHAKRAGWASITERECYLIDGCWRTSAAGSHCVYPLRTSHVTVRSSNDQETSSPDQRHLYGLPSCMPFNSSLTGADFLSQYHICLATGCSVNVDRNTYWLHLYQAGTGLPEHIKQQYLNLIYSGSVRPDNFQTIIQQLLSHAQQYPQTPIYGPLPLTHLLPLSLNLPERNLQLPVGGGIGGYGGQGQLPGGLGNLGGQLPPGLGLGNQGGLGSLFQPHVPSCPYQLPQYHGLGRLSGSFEGCCDKPLCYLPRQQLYNQYSGVSSYLTPWSQWTQCTVTCGGGRQTRMRECVGNQCDESQRTEQQRTCELQPCPYYLNWSEFGDCSATCGGGVRTRQRPCSGTGCEGQGTESATCREGACPTFEVGEWSECSVTMGQGYRTRSSRCISGGAYGCPTPQQEQESCEIFAGNSVRVCDQVTCLYKIECRLYDGTEGHCPRDAVRAPQYPQRCYDHSHCYCQHHPFQFGCTRSLNVGK